MTNETLGHTYALFERTTANVPRAHRPPYHPALAPAGKTLSGTMTQVAQQLIAAIQMIVQQDTTLQANC